MWWWLLKKLQDDIYLYVCGLEGYRLHTEQGHQEELSTEDDRWLYTGRCCPSCTGSSLRTRQRNYTELYLFGTIRREKAFWSEKERNNIDCQCVGCDILLLAPSDGIHEPNLQFLTCPLWPLLRLQSPYAVQTYSWSVPSSTSKKADVQLFWHFPSYMSWTKMHSVGLMSAQVNVNYIFRVPHWLFQVQIAGVFNWHMGLTH